MSATPPRFLYFTETCTARSVEHVQHYQLMEMYVYEGLAEQDLSYKFDMSNANHYHCIVHIIPII